MLALLQQQIVSPKQEMVAYETLWSIRNQSLKTLSDQFKQHPVTPARLLQIDEAERLLLGEDLRGKVQKFLEDFGGFSVCLHGSAMYPRQLRDARHPIELFYYKGDIGLARTPSVSVVGARKCSPAGLRRAARLAKELVAAGYTIVSGLAEGIDTAAMTSAISAGGRVIGVIGTPITKYYPPQNHGLQDEVADKHLLISQVPFYRYFTEHFKSHKRYFPERNETMAALSCATVIVEASETSGTHSQARACLQKGRPLFILNSCFGNPKITWPEKYVKEGAHRVGETADIIKILGMAVNGAPCVDED
jgi:DNA processing protein